MTFRTLRTPVYPSSRYSYTIISITVKKTDSKYRRHNLSRSFNTDQTGQSISLTHAYPPRYFDRPRQTFITSLDSVPALASIDSCLDIERLREESFEEW